MPDHYGVALDGTVVRRLLVGDGPLLSETQIAQIAQQARAAAAHEGQPLDLEWAIDHAGQLFWLQHMQVSVGARTRIDPT